MSSKIKSILEEYVNGLSKMLGNALKQVILYGSYARGEQNQNGEHSDIDIMILVDLSEEEIKAVEKNIFDYTFDMDLKYNLLFSPIVESVESYKQRQTFIPFYKNVCTEGVVING